MSEIGVNTRKLLDQLLSSKDESGTAEVKGVLLECADGRINLFAHVEKNSDTGSDSIMGEVVILGGGEGVHAVGYKDFGWYSTSREAGRAILGSVDLLLKKQKLDQDRMSALGFGRQWWGLYRYGELTVSVNPYGCVVSNMDDSLLRDTIDPARAFRMYVESSVDTLSKIPKELVDRLVKSSDASLQSTTQKSPFFLSKGNPVLHQ